MKVFFSTVIRTAPRELGGEVVRLDWESKAVEDKVPIFPTSPDLVHDPNPRGSTRGGRGILLFDGKVVVASYHTLKVYDGELRHLRDISHPLMVGLHEICSSTEGRVWVSSTSIDAALEFDLETGHLTRQHWPREMPKFQQALGLTPLDIDKQADNRDRFLSRSLGEGDPSHLHLNAVASWQGEMYALFHHFGAIVNLDKEEIVLQDKALRSTHSLVIEGDGTAIVAGTFARTLRIYDLTARKLDRVIDLTQFQWVRNLTRWRDVVCWARKSLYKIMPERFLQPPRPLFVRGLDVVQDLFLVGVSPASILCIDRHTGKLVDVYSYSRDVHVCVHGLRALVE